MNTRILQRLKTRTQNPLFLSYEEFYTICLLLCLTINHQKIQNKYRINNNIIPKITSVTNLDIVLVLMLQRGLSFNLFYVSLLNRPIFFLFLCSLLCGSYQSSLLLLYKSIVWENLSIAVFYIMPAMYPSMPSLKSFNNIPFTISFVFLSSNTFLIKFIINFFFLIF